MYNRLLDDVETGQFDLVVVHEISRLSRLGPTEIHEFIQHCLEHDTGVEALDVGLKIHVDDGDLQQTRYSMVARLMGDLAQIDRQQKLQRIRSVVRAAQSAGKWTGRPPAGCRRGRLPPRRSGRIPTRPRALTRVDRGESFGTVAGDTGIAESTLRSLHQDRRDLYLGGEAEDDRVAEALTDVRLLQDARAEDPNLEELRERVERLEEATDINNH